LDGFSVTKASARLPRTVDELRHLALAIGRSESVISLGAKAHAVLCRLVDHPEETALRTISELAQRLGVSPSTLTRLATRLGYRGFADFHSVFRDTFTKSTRKFYARQAQRLINDAHTISPESELGAVAKLAQESIRNIDAFVRQIDPDDLAHAAHLLAHARRVRVFGLRQIHSLASFLTYGLGMLRTDVALLDGPGGGVAEGLAQMEPGNVLVVASMAPYTRTVVDVARVAAQAGVVVIALTDTRASPLVPPARHAFFISHESSFISNSMGAYVVFCECLLNLVARDLSDRALNAVRQREGFISQLNIEMG
jgi:DNA-binding MurR/RpiR family transcriptional regulator